MIRKVILILILLTGELLSQGFNWQVSKRYPVEMPDEFYGLGLEYSMGIETGDFNLLERMIPCCRFTDGSSNSFAINIFREKWLKNGNSYFIYGNIKFLNSNFEINNKEAIRDGIFETKYIFDSKTTRLGIGGAYKIKFDDVSINLIGGSEINLSIKQSDEYRERAVSNNVPFDERILFEGTVGNYNKIQLIPFIEVSKDLDMGYGMYATTGLRLNYTLNSQLQDESWRSLFFSVNVRVFLAL